MLATELGKIRLVMRGMEDDQVVPSASISVADLLGGTEGADREKEGNTPSQNTNLLDLLSGKNENKTQVEVTPVAEDEHRTWRMRILEGGNVVDYKMKEVEENGVTHWQVEGEKEEDPGYSVASSDVPAAPAGGTTQPGTEPDPQGGSGAEPASDEPKPDKQKPESD